MGGDSQVKVLVFQAHREMQPINPLILPPFSSSSMGSLGSLAWTGGDAPYEDGGDADQRGLSRIDEQDFDEGDEAAHAQAQAEEEEEEESIEAEVRREILVRRAK